jgi:hypothetical protein
MLPTLGPLRDARASARDASPPIALALEQLQVIDLPFGGAVALWQRESESDCNQIIRSHDTVPSTPHVTKNDTAGEFIPPAFFRRCRLHYISGSGRSGRFAGRITSDEDRLAFPPMGNEADLIRQVRSGLSRSSISCGGMSCLAPQQMACVPIRQQGIGVVELLSTPVVRYGPPAPQNAQATSWDAGGKHLEEYAVPFGAQLGEEGGCRELSGFEREARL